MIQDNTRVTDLSQSNNRPRLITFIAVALTVALIDVPTRNKFAVLSVIGIAAIHGHRLSDFRIFRTAAIAIMIDSTAVSITRVTQCDSEPTAQTL